MNILIMGLGSMGTRRLKLIKSCLPTCNITGVDARADRRTRAATEYSARTYASLDEAVSAGKLDCAFICTPPLTHSSVILSCLNAGMHVFSEINLVADGYSKIMAVAKEKNLILFLSSTPMYRGEIQYITGRIKEQQQALGYVYHVGQYLPDWHPWESFQDFFVADKRSNACRELFAIELPWMLDTFGAVASVVAHKTSLTTLGLSYQDSYSVLLTHQNGTHGTLFIDVVSRKAVRRLEVFGEHLHLTWEGTPQTLRDYRIEDKFDSSVNVYEQVEKDGRYSVNIIENMYRDEILAFFACLRGEASPRHSFESDCEILALIDRIEED